ncbi:MAG: MurR/RpiR family transcriptional regulator [Caldilineaceae bacterium]
MSAALNYRDKVRATYDGLSRSYRRVADYILTNYYEVSFMTAAQLAYYVGVDTTTVVRFSQRLGYNGYPELLHDIRLQVKSEIYASYSEAAQDEGDGIGAFKARVQRDQHSLSQMLVHNPPEHVARVAALLSSATQIVLIGEGHAAGLAEMAAQQLRLAGRFAWSAPGDPARLATMLNALAPGTLVVGVTASPYGREVARAMEFARARGCSTLGIVGSLASPANRMSDVVVYAPAEGTGPLPSLVALTAALSALASLPAPLGALAHEATQEGVAQVYEFLVQPNASIPEDEG